MIRLLHAADVHLDTGFTGRSSGVRRRLRDASREAFRRVVETAVTERVDLVVIAGDLFDGDTLSFETERILGDGFTRLADAGIAVVYVTGNHDPGERLSRDRMRWPETVHVVTDGTPVTIEVRDEDGALIGRVTGAGHHSDMESRDLAASFPAPKGGVPEIAVLHTQIVGSRAEDDHDPYAPAALSTLTAAGYDYWALGHVHLRQCLSDLPTVHYPGNVQGRTWKETGPKGVLVAEVEAGRPAVTRFVPLAPVRWELLRVRDLDEVGSLDRLVAAVRGAWERERKLAPDPGTEWMVRVVLEGGCPLWRTLRSPEECDALGNELVRALGVLDVDVVAGMLHPVVDVEAHIGREDVLGYALRLLRETATGGHLPDGIGDELAIGALSEAELRAYLAEILEDAEGELLSRLRVEEAG